MIAIPNLRTALIGGRPANYFGDGSDGVLNTSGDVTFTSTLDGAPVVKQYTSVTINPEHTVTTSNRCKGLWIYCLGNVTISGLLTMTAKGAAATGSNVTNAYSASKSGVDTLFRINSSGATGGSGAGRSNRSGSGGSNGSSTVSAGLVQLTTGGGGSGAGPITALPGAGGAGTSFGGGTGGGAVFGNACDSADDPFINGSSYGGSGGNSATNGVSWGGAGAGNNGGIIGGATCASNPIGTGPSGTGGIIFIIAKGNVTINGGGVISADGVNGGIYGGSGGDGGGASGGGIVMILTGGTYTNSGTVRAIGGSGGVGDIASGYGPGGIGGNGIVYNTQIDT